ncbi:MAG: methionine synthase [Synergistaceae bacterium]|nr:methionine synthase [Synergistaceae bacterium]
MPAFVRCYIQNVMLFTVSDKLIIDALRYMRVPPDSHNDELINTVREAFTRLENFVMPRFVWGRFPIVHFDGGIELAGAYIYSQNIARLTSRSNECYLLAVTLGSEVDRQINIAQQKNMLDGLALDSCASVMADSFCDEFIKSQIVPGLHKGEHLTSRFSPGYGDLSMSVIEDIITILNASKRIGLSVTRSLMMSPIKSITAIIGIAHREE